MSPRRAAAIACAVALALGGCGGDSDDGETSAPSSVADSTTTTATLALLERPEVVSPASIPVTTRAVESADLDSLDFLAADDTYVYARREAGVVEMIDPASMEAVRSVDLGGHGGQGIGAGQGAVWAGAADGVARIDPTTAEITATVDVVKVRDQGHIPVAFDAAWILTDDGTTLVAVDPDTAEIGRTLDIPVRGTEVWASRDALWVASSVDDAVVRVDPEDGAVTMRIAVEEPRHVRVHDDVVWVATSFGVHRLDADGTETGAVGAGAGRDGGMELDADGAVWVRSARTVLHRIDPDSLEVTDRVELPLLMGGSVIVGFGWVWGSAYDEAEALLFRVAL